MKIYAIFGDNGEMWEDHWYGIMEEHIYSSPGEAEQACFKLNHPIIIQPTKQEWENCGWECTWEEFLEDFNNPDPYTYTYTVRELNVK